MFDAQSTIVALSTGNAQSAIALIRLTGYDSIAIVNKIFIGTNLNEAASHTLYFGKITDSQNNIIDEVVVGIFKNPKSYTGEDVVEISCHGSNYIVQQILNLCIINGARIATPGEFTKRAFMNGKLDLSQAEAVADLIASNSQAQHKIAMHQMRGGFSNELNLLRQKLIDFAALIELELDFSEEDVEFADRTALKNLLSEIKNKLSSLSNSFKLGNAIKNGIPIAIIGKPNAGKSTLLNYLLQEDKAIVSDIAGTTRDAIEDTININGTLFRFIDTAGIRQTNDTIEKIGIEKTFEKTKQAQIVLLLVNATEKVEDIIDEWKNLNINQDQYFVFAINKIDETGACNAYDVEEALMTLTKQKAIAISAKTGLHIDKLIEIITHFAQTTTANDSQTIITNQRHYHAINDTLNYIQKVQQGMEEKISGEFLSHDIRNALHSLGSITGKVEHDKDILGSIFGKFCIGK